MKNRFGTLKTLCVTMILGLGILLYSVSPAAAEPASPDMPVKRGMYGDEVSKLQNKLKEYGY